jgi:hypothetical protein
MKSLVICLLTHFVFGYSVTLSAQNQPHPEDALFQPSSLLIQELAAGENVAIVIQTGNRNHAQVQQMHQQGEDANLVISEQNGRHNTVNLIQEGSGNQSIVLQHGNQNTYNGNVSGTGLQTYILQDGNRNTITQSLTESVNTSTELIQIGNDNEIIHEIDGAVNQSFHLIQQGDGQSVIIRQSYGN